MSPFPPTLYLLTPDCVAPVKVQTWESARQAAAVMKDKGVLVTPDGHAVEPTYNPRDLGRF